MKYVSSAILAAQTDLALCGRVRLNSKTGNIEATGFLAPIDKAALSVAWNRARFYSNGRTQLVARNHRKVTRAHALKSGKRHTAKIYDGTGLALSPQEIFELYLAARASFIEGDQTGRSFSDSYRAAAASAQSLLRKGARLQVFDDIETAMRAGDRASRRFAESFEAESDCAYAQAQPHAAEFLAQAPGEESINPRALVARCLARARLALRAHYASKTYPRRKADRARDSKALRMLAREILEGVATRTKRDDEANYQRNLDLSRRMESGFALVTPAVERQGDKGTRGQGEKRPVELMTLPCNRAEHDLDNVRIAASLPYTRTLLSRADAKRPAGADALATLAAFFAQAHA